MPSSQQRDKINCIKERNENETRRGLPPPLSHRQCALLCSALLWLFQLESKRTPVLSFLSFSSSFFFFAVLLIRVQSPTATVSSRQHPTNRPTHQPTRRESAIIPLPLAVKTNLFLARRINKKGEKEGKKKKREYRFKNVLFILFLLPSIYMRSIGLIFLLHPVERAVEGRHRFGWHLASVGSCFFFPPFVLFVSLFYGSIGWREAGR